jgi:hypothetical protein
MLTWVIYDISNDKARPKIADRCLDYGLYRVQKSVFLGNLDSNRVDEVILFSKNCSTSTPIPCTSSACAATISTRSESWARFRRTVGFGWAVDQGDLISVSHP